MIRGQALSSVKLRSGPGTEYPELGYGLKFGNKIEASEHINQWLHIVKINGVDMSVSGWASAGTSQQYIKWEVIEAPPDNPPVPPTPPEPDEYILHIKDGITRKFVPL
jgi:hypothetical protein